jgi:hypothetical protein
MRRTSRHRSAARWLGAGLRAAGGAYAAYVGLAWARYGRVRPPDADERDALLDRFMPAYDVVERHHIRVKAPAAVTLAAASEMDLFQLLPVRAIFSLRAVPRPSTVDFDFERKAPKRSDDDDAGEHADVAERRRPRCHDFGGDEELESEQNSPPEIPAVGARGRVQAIADRGDGEGQRRGRDAGEDEDDAGNLDQPGDALFPAEGADEVVGADHAAAGVLVIVREATSATTTVMMPTITSLAIATAIRLY